MARSRRSDRRDHGRRGHADRRPRSLHPTPYPNAPCAALAHYRNHVRVERAIARLADGEQNLGEPMTWIPYG
jgi:hypothetical protein